MYSVQSMRTIHKIGSDAPYINNCIRMHVQCSAHHEHQKHFFKDLTMTIQTSPFGIQSNHGPNQIVSQRPI